VTVAVGSNPPVAVTVAVPMMVAVGGGGRTIGMPTFGNPIVKDTVAPASHPAPDRPSAEPGEAVEGVSEKLGVVVETKIAGPSWYEVGFEASFERM
jgi:hypothetical protein